MSDQLQQLLAELVGDYPMPSGASLPCATSDPEAWMPGPGQRAVEPRRICRQVCEWQAGCLSWAISAAPVIGIWAGYSAREIRRMRRDLGLELADEAGDEAGDEVDVDQLAAAADARARKAAEMRAYRQRRRDRERSGQAS